MLNFQNLLFKCIGKRIDNFQKSHYKTRSEFIRNFGLKELFQLTPEILSSTIKGKCSGKRSAVLSQDMIRDFSHFMKIGSLELIWGSAENREDIAKMIILAFMSNGDIDYKTGEEFNPFLEHEWRKEIYPLEERYPYSNTFDDGEAFFHNKDNYDSYEVLKNGYDKRYDKLSSLICKRLDGFIDANYPQYVGDFIQLDIDPDSPDYDSEFKKFLKIKDVSFKKFQFLADRMHYKEWGYYHFANEIFPAFWEKYKKIYMDFFNEYIFEIKSDFIENGIQHYWNEYFDEHFLSPRFIEINRDSNDQFYNDKIDKISPIIKKRKRKPKKSSSKKS